MTTPRELVYRTLEWASPERVPRQMWLLPWAESHHKDMVEKIGRDFPEDIVNPPAIYRDPPKTVGDAYAVGQFIDEWGCVFENRIAGIIGEVKSPLVTGENWEDFDKVHIPVELLSVDEEAINRFCAETDKFVLHGITPRIFEQLQFIRGTEQLYIDIALENEGMLRAIKTMHAFYCELMTKWARTDVDGLMFMDDWGTQKSLLINPKTWEKIFKPLYKDYVDIAHSHGKKIFMHSDGYILDIIPHLIEIGIDALNSQIFCMGIENLAPFAGKITFWGEMDRQRIIPYGTRDEVREAVEAVYRTLWRDGGCVALCEFGIGANPENVYTVFETWNHML